MAYGDFYTGATTVGGAPYQGQRYAGRGVFTPRAPGQYQNFSDSPAAPAAPHQSWQDAPAARGNFLNSVARNNATHYLHPSMYDANDQPIHPAGAAPFPSPMAPAANQTASGGNDRWAAVTTPQARNQYHGELKSRHAAAMKANAAAAAGMDDLAKSQAQENLKNAESDLHEFEGRFFPGLNRPTTQPSATTQPSGPMPAATTQPAPAAQPAAPAPISAQGAADNARFYDPAYRAAMAKAFAGQQGPQPQVVEGPRIPFSTLGPNSSGGGISPGMAAMQHGNYVQTYGVQNVTPPTNFQYDNSGHWMPGPTATMQYAGQAGPLTPGGGTAAPFTFNAPQRPIAPQPSAPMPQQQAQADAQAPQAPMAPMPQSAAPAVPAPQQQAPMAPLSPANTAGAAYNPAARTPNNTAGVSYTQRAAKSGPTNTAGVPAQQPVAQESPAAATQPTAQAVSPQPGDRIYQGHVYRQRPDGMFQRIGPAAGG